MPERLSSQSILPNFLVNWEQFAEIQARLMLKKNPSFFPELEKLRSPARAIFKNSKISLQIGKNLEVQPKANSRKPQF